MQNESNSLNIFYFTDKERKTLQSIANHCEDQYLASIIWAGLNYGLRLTMKAQAEMSEAQQIYALSELSGNAACYILECPFVEKASSETQKLLYCMANNLYAFRDMWRTLLVSVLGTKGVNEEFLANMEKMFLVSADKTTRKAVNRTIAEREKALYHVIFG